MRTIQTSLAVALLGLAACHTSSGDVFTRNTGPEAAIQLGGSPSELVWGHVYGSNKEDRPHRVLALADGGAILAGVFGGPQASAHSDPTAIDAGPIDAGSGDAGPVTGTVNLGGADLPVGSSYTGFIARYDATGATVWSLTLPGNGTSEVMGLATTSDGGLVACGTVSGTIDLGGGPITVPASSSRMFVLELDASGHFVWARVLGDNLAAYGVAVDDEGNVYATANFPRGTVTIDGIELSSSGQSTLILSLDAEGTTRWAQLRGASDQGTPVADAGPGPSGGGGGTLSALEIVADAHGIVLAGGFAGTVDLGDGTSATVQGNSDDIVIALGKDGAFQWARRFGGAGQDWISGLALQADGSIALGGEFTATASFAGATLVGDENYSQPFVALIERDGQTARWATAAPTHGHIHGVAASPGGEVLAVGDASGIGDDRLFGAFVGVFAATDGQLVRARVFPGTGIVTSGGLVGHGVVAAGSYAETIAPTIDLGAGYLPNYGDSDIFVGQLQF